MAKQAGDIFIEGTIDDLTFYKMDGKYYVRMKSALTGKKFWRNKAFERSRESCKRFSEGNRLASKLYRMIEKEKRQYKLFCFLKKRAILLLKEGRSLIEAEEVLMDYLKEFGMVEMKGRRNCSAKNKKIISLYKMISADSVQHTKYRNVVIVLRQAGKQTSVNNILTSKKIVEFILNSRADEYGNEKII